MHINNSRNIFGTHSQCVLVASILCYISSFVCRMMTKALARAESTTYHPQNWIASNETERIKESVKRIRQPTGNTLTHLALMF